MTNREAAIQVIRTLREHDHQALLAGGCVRDMLLKRPAKDYDVATSAEPADVTQLFKRTLEVGAQFGVVIVLVKSEQIEVATFRIDGSYVDGRRPENIEFTTAEEDASRRDFTVNGMFYDPIEETILDYVGGQEDIQRRVIRTIGTPRDRFNEDYLRMMRAVRFAAQLSFTIEPETLKAIQTDPERITQVSGERICMELQGLLTCPGRQHGARLFWETGLAPAVFPTFTQTACTRALAVLACLRGSVSFPLALAAWFADVETEAALASCESLKMSNRELSHLRFLLDGRFVLLNDAMSRSQLRLLYSEPYFHDLFAYQRALLKAAGQALTPLVALKRRIRAWGTMDVKPAPLLNGKVVIQLGVTPGPHLGACLEAVYRAQLDDHIHNKDEARDFAQRWLAERDLI